MAKDIIETWKPIQIAPGSEVSDLGRVRSVDRVVFAAADRRRKAHERRYRGQFLRPGRTSSGHLTVMLGQNVGSRYVHILVLEAFVGPCPNGMECLHKDDVPDDNRLERLRWGTRSENLKEAWANGKRA